MTGMGLFSPPCLSASCAWLDEHQRNQKLNIKVKILPYGKVQYITYESYHLRQDRSAKCGVFLVEDFSSSFKTNHEYHWSTLITMPQCFFPFFFSTSPSQSVLIFVSFILKAASLVPNNTPEQKKTLLT